jgi:carboxyl-terminal processing protease
LIQRDYSNKSFFDYYYARKEPTQNKDDAKSTDTGRKMFGGGGITPDVKYDNPHSTLFQRRIFSSSIIYHFASKYFGPNKPALPVGWMPDDELMSRFKDYLQSNDFPVTDAEFQHDKKWLREQLRDEFYLRAFDKKTSERAVIVDDPEVAKAVDALPQAEKLHSEAEKLTPRRM